MSGPITETGAWQSWWDKTGSQPPITDDTPPPAALPLRPVRPAAAPLPSAARGPALPDPMAQRGRRRAEPGRGRSGRGRSGHGGRSDESYDPLPAPRLPAAGADREPRRTGSTRAEPAPRGRTDRGRGAAPRGATEPPAGLQPLGPPRGLADTGAGRPGGPPRGLADTGAGRLPGPDGRTRPTGSSAGLQPLGPPRGIADTGAGRPGAPPRGLADTGAGRLPGPDGRTRPTGSSADLHPLGARARGAAEPEIRPGRVDAPQRGRTDQGRAQPETGTRRGGATRSDLVTADMHGSTALARRVDRVDRVDLVELPAPDEVTDTGARRARNAFKVAEGPSPEDDFDDEPSLVLQWGVFLAQTLTGAAVGLGVWLGFYRLWAAWPFYAAPAVGVALAGMLVVARTLRRRYGHELDLVTAVVTIAVGTVLTVLPAAFTLQTIG